MRRLIDPQIECDPLTWGQTQRQRAQAITTVPQIGAGLRGTIRRVSGQRAGDMKAVTDGFRTTAATTCKVVMAIQHNMTPLPGVELAGIRRDGGHFQPDALHGMWLRS